MEFKITSDSSDFTRYLGKNLSKLIAFGDLVLFSGELGAGKTTFISGLAKGLGVKEDLSSPSFTILNTYPLKDDKKFVHADFYRLDNVRDMIEVGIEDYIYRSNCVVCIEWGNKLKDYLENGYLENGYLEIEINYWFYDENGSESNSCDWLNRRIITFSGSNTYWNKKIEKLKAVLL